VNSYRAVEWTSARGKALKPTRFKVGAKMYSQQPQDYKSPHPKLPRAERRNKFRLWDFVSAGGRVRALPQKSVENMRLCGYLHELNRVC